MSSFMLDIDSVPICAAIYKKENNDQSFVRDIPGDSDDEEITQLGDRA